MKIAIISDIHDQINNLSWALDLIKEKEIAHIFMLGDYVSPFVIDCLRTNTIPIHAVWGNCDGDKQRMCAIIREKSIPISFADDTFANITIDGRKYFITHYPELAENAAKSDIYDAVFHGHTHKKRAEKIMHTPIINPGKLALYPNNEFSFAIFDAKDLSTDFVIK